MERPEQHQIDSQAENILRRILPKNWLCSDIEPDYGIDHHIEPADETKLTGLVIDVQLKGKRRVKGSKPPSYALETEHLKYYLNRRQPVFLIVIDNEREIGYWVFTQKYALEELAGKNWRSQKTVTIKFREDQTISNAARFRKAIEDADKYMIGQHPHAISEGLKAKRQLLEQLDPRFQVVVNATEDAIHCSLLARESMEVQLVFKGDEKRQAQFYSDLIGKGLPVKLEPGEMSVEGSALLNKVISEAAMIQRESRIDVEVNVSAVDINGQEIGRVPINPAFVEGGVEELRLRAEMRNSILVVAGTMGPGGIAHLRFNYKLDRWAGQPLLTLPYFDQLKKLFRSLADGNLLRLDCSISGYAVVGGHVEVEKQKWAAISAVLDCIDRARELALRFGVCPLFPEQLDAHSLSEIDDAYEQLRPGPLPAPDFDLTTRSQRDALRRAAAQSPDGTFGQGNVRIQNTGGKFNLFGQTVTVPAFISEITCVKPDIENLFTELAKDSPEPLIIRWRGTDQSIRTCRPVTANDLNDYEKPKDL